ncbi:hypothetical protein N9L68_07270, partial [bacterium]|nr:hypothetical protein [bacterium]
MAPEMVGNVFVPLQEGQGREDAAPDIRIGSLNRSSYPSVKLEFAACRAWSMTGTKPWNRWAKGRWLGHARHSPYPDCHRSGDREALAIRRMPEGQQWDGDRVKRIRGSSLIGDWAPARNFKMVEIEDKSNPELNPLLEGRVGQRTGEKKAKYPLSRDFENNGYKDGCIGCRDVASGKKRAGSFISPHNSACRRRMDNAVR